MLTCSGSAETEALETLNHVLITVHEDAIRTPTRIEFEDVPLRGDTVTCGSTT